MEELSSHDYETAKRPTKFPRNLLLVTFFILFIGILAVIGIGYFAAGDKKPAITPTPITAPTTALPTEPPSPTVVTSVTPTGSAKTAKTPTPSLSVATGGSVDKATGLDRTQLTVQILNGSGVAGAAKGVSQTLQVLGYKIAGTGNADAFTYENVVIQVKKSKSQYLPLLQKDLAKDYTVGSVSASLSSTSLSDAVIIVGKEK